MLGCLMDLKIFAIRYFVRYLHHGESRLVPPLVLFYLLRVQVKGSDRSLIQGICLPGRYKMSSVGYSNTQRVLDVWPERSLEDESAWLSMPFTTPPRKCSQHTLTALSAFRLHAPRLGYHEPVASVLLLGLVVKR